MRLENHEIKMQWRDSKRKELEELQYQKSLEGSSRQHETTSQKPKLTTARARVRVLREHGGA